MILLDCALCFSMAFGVICHLVRVDGAIRLVGGRDTIPNAGQVEIWHEDSSQWATVCDRYWSFNDVRVTCRELGYPGVALVKCDSFFGVPERNLTIGGFYCDGGGSNLLSCGRTDDFSSTPCTSGAAGVICTAPGYVGCFQDNQYDRFLRDQEKQFDNLSVDKCLKYCGDYRFAAVEYDRWCFCGNRWNFVGSSYTSDDTKCKEPCIGNSNQTCGGNNYRLSLYEVNSGNCTDPGTPSYGTRTVLQATHRLPFYFGTIIDFNCDHGFALNRTSARIQCLLVAGSGAEEKVAWNDSVPACNAAPTSISQAGGLVTDSLPRTQQKTGEGNTDTQNLSQGVIAGVVIAVTLVLLAVVVLAFFVLRKKSRSTRKRGDQTLAIFGQTTDGMVTAVNPTYSNLEVIPSTQTSVYSRVNRKEKPVENAYAKSADAVAVEGAYTYTEPQEDAVTTKSEPEGVAHYANCPRLPKREADEMENDQQEEVQKPDDGESGWVENIIYE